MLMSAKEHITTGANTSDATSLISDTKIMLRVTNANKLCD